MASLVLGVLATSSLGAGASATAIAVAGMIGSTIGSIIDNKVLLPTLFPEDTPTPNAPNLPQKAEGGNAYYIMGTNCRVPVQILWQSSALRHTFAGQKLWAAHVMVGIARQLEYGATQGKTAMRRLNRIYAHGKILWAREARIDITSNKIRVTAQLRTVGDPKNPTIPIITQTSMTYVADAGANVDLSRFFSNDTLSVSGFATAAANGTRRVMSAGTNSLGETWVKVLVWQRKTPTEQHVSGVSEAKGQTITMTQSTPSSRADELGGLFQKVGDGAQTPDGTVLGFEDAQNVAGMRWTAAAVLTHLNISKYGNSIPVMEAEVSCPSPLWDTREQVDHLCKAAGVPPEFVDTKSIWLPQLDTIRHYVNDGPKSYVETIDNLLLVNDAIMQERDAVLTFYGKDQAEEHAIEFDDLATDVVGSEGDYPFRVEDVEAESLPTKVILQFLDEDNDMQPGEESATINTPDPENVRYIRVPYGMTHTQAKKIATRLLWSPRQVTKRMLISLPPRYWHILENDIITFTDDTGYPWRLLVVKRDRGVNGLLKFQAVEHPSIEFLSPAHSATNPKFKSEAGPRKAPALLVSAVSGAF